MKVRVVREPCYFAEAVYLLYYFVNGVSYVEEYHRISQKYRSYHPDRSDEGLIKARELDRVLAAATRDIDPQDPKLRLFFERLAGTVPTTACCLAQVMLMTVPLDRSDPDEFAADLLAGFRSMCSEGIKINDINAMGLIVEHWEPQQEQESLSAQIEHLPCAIEAKWEILRALTEFESFLAELMQLVRPVAERLRTELETMRSLNAPALERWSAYFSEHTVDKFREEMFGSSFLFPQDLPQQDVLLGIWSCNMIGFWSEWLERGGESVRVAYAGSGLSFDFAASHRKRPDPESLSAMLRALSGKDRLEILQRCRTAPLSAARLAEAMNLNSGTVSRNLYDLYKLGYLETRGDGERVNYITRPEAVERLFQWIMDFIKS